MIQEFNEQLVKSTYKVEAAGSMGSAFALTQRIAVGTNTNAACFVLLTATHVFAGFGSNSFTIVGRKAGTNSEPVRWTLNTYRAGKKLWINHPSQDVAAMRIYFPNEAEKPQISDVLLATDDFYRDRQVTVGEEVRIAGFPLGDESYAGFPIVRSGRIASYPIVPTDRFPLMLVDFPVFPGNSGGPVYITSTKPISDGQINTVSFVRILGLVSSEKLYLENSTTMGEDVRKRHKLGLANVVHARFIREVLEMLPAFEADPAVNNL